MSPFEKNARMGAICAIGAFGCWGFIPLYFKQIDHVPALETLCHRIAWTAALLLLLRQALAPRGSFLRVLRTPRLLGMLALSSAFISTNWLLFTWSVNEGRVLDTSLGYFINPLLSVLLGVVFLRESLRPLQRAAVGIAAAAVLFQFIRFGEIPWVALTLAFSFGMYGFIRKQTEVDPFTGLFFETLVAAPFAAAWIAWLYAAGSGHFIAGDASATAWLLFAGPATTLPLALFAAAARRLNLATLGFLQYLTPSLSFCLAVFVFQEPFGWSKLATFALIWLALACYSADALRSSRIARRPRPVPAAVSE